MFVNSFMLCSVKCFFLNICFQQIAFIYLFLQLLAVVCLYPLLALRAVQVVKYYTRSSPSLLYYWHHTVQMQDMSTVKLNTRCTSKSSPTNRAVTIGIDTKSKVMLSYTFLIKTRHTSGFSLESAAVVTTF